MSYINIRGYNIKKKDKTEKELDKIKKKLEILPQETIYTRKSDSPDEENKGAYKLYNETKNTLSIPRFYGIKKFGKCEERFDPKKSTLKFNTDLRDYQKPIVKHCVEYMKEKKGCILSVPCGRGKTVMAIYIAYKLKLKTLVVVHQSFLQDQWIERIKFFTGETAGTIRQDIVQVNSNIVVGMVQSIASRDYGDIYDDFGLVIYDECHHYGSRLFCETIMKLNSKYVLGLSATPYRKDGLMNLVNWNMGEIAYQEKSKANKYVVVKKINFISENSKYKEINMVNKGKQIPNCAKMVSNFIEIEERDDIIINVINSLRKDHNRKILILSGRNTAHLPNLKSKVDALIQKDVENGVILKDECKTSFYTGDTSREDRKNAEDTADIIFATFHMAQEGLDIPRLNTVIFATSKKDVVQAVGRILRKETKDGDIRPLIIDMVDTVSVFQSQSFVRDKYYNENKFIVQYYYMFDDVFFSPAEYVKYKNISMSNPSKRKPKNIEELLEIPDVNSHRDDYENKLCYDKYIPEESDKTNIFFI